MIIEILFKDNSRLTIENVFAVSNTSSKIENDMILVKKRFSGNEWIPTTIKVKDILCMEVRE